MNSPSEGSDDTESQVQELNIGLDIQSPVRQPAFPVTEQQWNHLKEQICRIRPSESLWFSASLALLTLGISLTISATQLGSVEDWIRTTFWTAAAAGFVGAVVCGIAYWENRKRRIDDIQAVLNYMKNIEQTYGS